MMHPEKVAKRKQTATVTAIRDPVSSLVAMVGWLEGRGRGDVGLEGVPVGSIDCDGSGVD